MSRFINPLLIDKPAATPPAARNYARKIEAPAAPAFAEQLAAVDAVKTTDKAPETATATKTADIKPASTRLDYSPAVVNEEEFGVTDFLDILNPLQHIPIIGTVYRETTGDEIKPLSRVAGGILFGAATGTLLLSAAASVVTAAFEQQTGEDALVQVANLFTDDEPVSRVASAAVAPPASREDRASPAQVALATAAVEKGLAETPTPPAAKPAQTEAASKVPFGGVMDVAAINRRQPLVSERVIAEGKTPVTRLGNTIYTGPALNSAARIAAVRAPEPVAAAPAVTPPEEQDRVSANASTPVAAPADSQSLGRMMHEQAQAGHSLPPDLVRDMMTMALEKYKTAGNLSSGAMSTAAPQ